ncbi:MAG: hypothetical protein ABFD89_00880 [Bryobacteraceae bacterium]
MIGSLSAYGRHRKAARKPGGSLAAVQKAIRTGRIQQEPSGGIDFEKADAAWDQNTDARRRRTPREDSPEPPKENLPEEPTQELDGGSFFEAQRQREWERVKRERIQRKVLEGKLLDAEKVRDTVSEMISSARAKLLVIGDELADKLAATSDPVRCRELVDGRISQALDDLAEYPANAE